MERASVGANIINQPNLTRLMEESRGMAKELRKRKANLSINLEDVIKVVNEQPYDENTKKALVKIACSTPHGALDKFIGNLRTHVAAIHREVRKNLEDLKPMLSQQKQQELQQLKEARRNINKKTNNLFSNDDEQIATARQVETKELQQEQQQNEIKQNEAKTPQSLPQQPPQQPPQPQQPQSLLKAQIQPSREEVMEALEARRAFAQRLEKLDETDEEWLK